MQRMGGMSGVMSLLPGMGQMKKQLEGANIDDRILKRQTAIIDSMTKAERKNPDLLKASRKKRVAAGSGAKVEDINRLLKMHRQMADMMKMMGKGGRGAMAGLASKLGMGMPPGMGGGGLDPNALKQLQKGGAPQLPPNFPGAPGGLPPGFPGLGPNPFDKKK
jgi:signal recognition particle subunit SRP54